LCLEQSHWLQILSLFSAYAPPMLGLRYAYATEAILLDWESCKEIRVTGLLDQGSLITNNSFIRNLGVFASKKTISIPNML